MDSIVNIIGPMVAAFYYAFGFLWLSTGIGKGGWLSYEGPPFFIALWMVVAAALWPLILGHILWDLAHGRNLTELM